MARVVGSKNKVLHVWSEEEKKYLGEITSGHHYKEIQELMNKKFNYNFTLDQIKGAIGRYKLNTGFTGKFPKGNVPVNKGQKGVIYEGCKNTWFRKGNTPINHRPVGSERITVDGYTEVKVDEPNKWRLKQQIVWEKHNGPLPKGYVVIFGDKDTSNFDIKNLIVVSRKQLLTLNKYNLIQSDTELTKTGVVIADIYQKISEKKKA